MAAEETVETTETTDSATETDDTATDTTTTSTTKTSDELGPGGKAALDAERSARRRAEKQARETRQRLDALEAEKLSETEKLEKRAQDGDERAAKATTKLRRANLITALAEVGLVGTKAKAAARLLDQIEYDEDDEPSNLGERIAAAKKEFGAELFTVATTEPKQDKDTKDDDPDTHAGARPGKPSADEDELMGQYMRQHFPQMATVDNGN